MEIKELVPPLELCKLIPAGEFEDTALIWDKNDTVGFWDGQDKDGNHIGGFGKIPAMNWRVRQNFSERCRKRMKESGTVLNVYPAPTLQEILEQIPADKAEIVRIGSFKWNVDCGIVWQSGDCLIDTALKVWLKLKGIEA